MSGSSTLIGDITWYPAETFTDPSTRVAINFKWDEKLVRVPGGPGIPALWPAVNPQTVQYITNFDRWGKEDCAPAWKDPRNDIVAGLNELSEYGLPLSASHF